MRNMFSAYAFIVNFASLPITSGACIEANRSLLTSGGNTEPRLWGDIKQHEYTLGFVNTTNERTARIAALFARDDRRMHAAAETHRVGYACFQSGRNLLSGLQLGVA
eukprot:6198177-Pleurochrysis_carterae.AAC.1